MLSSFGYPQLLNACTARHRETATDVLFIINTLIDLEDRL